MAGDHVAGPSAWAAGEAGANRWQRASGRRIRWPRLIAATLLAVAAIAGFSSLGVWQMHRLHWKVALIERVDARVHAAPVPAPGPAAWPGITREGDEYRHVSLTGHFLPDADVLVYTPSDYGPAHWVLTPFVRDDGSIVMVNRGLLPENRKRDLRFAPPSGERTVTGLLRISEDKRWLFAQANKPEEGRWYRRDIAAITRAGGYGNAAPYFVDEDLGDPNAWPRGGQTVVHFRNAHLSYAMTWFALAALVLAGFVLVLRREVRGGLDD